MKNYEDDSVRKIWTLQYDWRSYYSLIGTRITLCKYKFTAELLLNNISRFQNDSDLHSINLGCTAQNNLRPSNRVASDADSERGGRGEWERARIENFKNAIGSRVDQQSLDFFTMLLNNLTIHYRFKDR